MGAAWDANRAVLLKRDPALLGRLEGAVPLPGVQILETRSGDPAMRAPDAAGQAVSLCSQYEPRAEARALVDAVPTGGMLSYAVLGLGLGYHAEALLEKASPESLVFLFESDPGLARAALEARDLSALLSSPRVHLHVGTDPTEIFERLEPHLVALYLGYRLVAHPPSLRRDPEGYRAVQKAILELGDYGETSLLTAMTISYLTKQNLCMNLAEYAMMPGLEALRDSWKGRPAVVIAAGPSLGRNLPLLKGLKGRCALISVGTALKPCLRAGVVPDLAATLDYSRLSAKYLEGLQGSPDVPLVVDPKGSWQAIASYPGTKYYIRNPYLDVLLDHALGSGEAQLDTGGTVAHLCYSLARWIGADPVVFVGLDLAYTHHTTHLPGTAIHDQWGPELNRFNTLEGKEWEQLARVRSRLKDLPARGGGRVLTDDQMFSYLQKFQKDWRKAGVRIVDATEGGALKEGAEAMPLSEALARFASSEGPPLPVPSLPDREARKGKVLPILEVRLRECAAVRGIYAETLKRLKRIERGFDDRELVSRQIRAIDRERSAIDRYRLMNALIGELTQADEFEKLKRDKAIAARRLEGLDRLKAQLERDLDYVQGLARGAEVLEHLLKIGRDALLRWPGRVAWTDPPAP